MVSNWKIKTRSIAAVILFAWCLIGCNRPGIGDAVRLEGELERGDSSVIRLYTADVTAANTILHRKRPGAFTYPLIVAAEVGSFDGVKNLIAAGAKINATNSSGETALMRAMLFESRYDERLNVVKHLIENGANVLHKDMYGNDALQNAARYRPASFLQLMLKAGADPNTSDINGDSALHVVRSITNAIVLLEAGAKLEVTNRSGQTPVTSAKERRRADLVRFLEEYRVLPREEPPYPR